MVFPDERSFYTARNVNPDFITEREEDLSERILTLANPHESTRDDLRNS